MIRQSFFILLSCFFLFSAVSCATYNPATGRYDYLIFTSDAEVAIGNIMHAQVRTGHALVDDEHQKARLQRVGHSIARVTDRQDIPYQFYLIKGDSLNAFTIPGGHIYVYEGLMKALDDDQLAAVMAHELAHNAAKHTIKKYQGVLGYNLIAGSIITRIEDDMKKRIAALGANFIVSLALNAYSREDEHEADRLGVKYTYLAGYDPYGMVEAFQLLDKNAKGDKTPDFLRTHPHFDDRIESVKNEIEAVKNKY